MAGGTGQIGTALAAYFKHRCEDIVVLSRSAKPTVGNVRTVKWDAATAGSWTSELEDADLLVNLTGKNVNCRYSARNKQEIFDSRTKAIQALAEASARCKCAPRVWIQLASATIYRHAEDRAMTELDGEIGDGFSVEVCERWENTFFDCTAALGATRTAVLRTSLVLSADEGVFPRLKNLVKAGLGGRQGNGRQMVSWIHEADVCGAIEWIANTSKAQGIYNCTAPEPLPNQRFMNVLRTGLGHRIGLPSPRWLLELGAIIIQTETELVLKSRWVLPYRLQAEGYTFRYPQLQEAVIQLVKGEYNHV